MLSAEGRVPKSTGEGVVRRVSGDVRIRRATIDLIIAEARAAVPRECCGILIGHGDEVVEAAPTRNLSEDENRFLIEPQGHFDALRDARVRGLDVVGFFHSHPHGDARASATDIAELSYPGHLYLIVGLGTVPPDLRIFEGQDAGFCERVVTVVENGESQSDVRR